MEKVMGSNPISRSASIQVPAKGRKPEAGFFFPRPIA